MTTTNPSNSQRSATLKTQRAQDFELAKSLVRDWLTEKGVALTGVNGEVSSSSVNRFKLDLQSRIVDALNDTRRARVAGPGGDGISWTALLSVLERLRSKNRNPDNEWYHGWNAAIQCLINDINSRAAASSATPAEAFYDAGNVYEATKDFWVDSSNTPAESGHLCPHCGRQMKSDFDEDVGMWYECENCDYREAVSNIATPPTSTSDNARRAAEEEFLAASVAVWQEIDRLSQSPEGYKGLDASTELRQRERAAWENYKPFAAAPAGNDAELSEMRFCWVCRSNHRLIASECRAMDSIA